MARMDIDELHQSTGFANPLQVFVSGKFLYTNVADFLEQCVSKTQKLMAR